jgi:hypothetical protein
MLVQFDVDPQQIVLGNLQTGMQVVATINMEDLIDQIALKGQPKVAEELGSAIIDLLKINESLISAIDVEKHLKDVADRLESE